MFCAYYVAKVLYEKTWFLTGCLKAQENLVFERTIDASKENHLIEFFVPPDREEEFLAIMRYLENEGVVLELEKKENRLIPEDATVD